MPLVNGNEGDIEIDGISMNPAHGGWGVFGDERGNGGLLQLWGEFDVRGDDRLLPGASGVIPYPRRMTVTRKDLRLLICGDVDSSGDPVTDSVIGLEGNIEFLRVNVWNPTGTTDGTRSATLTTPSGATRTAEIHVLGVVQQSYFLDASCSGSIWIGTLQISIPSGRFA